MRQRVRVTIGIGVVIGLLLAGYIGYDLIANRSLQRQFLAGPGGSILYLETRWKSVFDGFGTTQPIGMPGPRYRDEVTSSRLSLLPSPSVVGGESSPIEARHLDGRPLDTRSGKLIGWIEDVVVDEKGQLIISVDNTPDLVLPLDTMTKEFRPATLRSEVVAYSNHILADLPIHQGRSRSWGVSVTPFGLVEVDTKKEPRDTVRSKAKEIIRHEWSPDRDGLFTRWWEKPSHSLSKFSRYQPPFPFDSIDRRTTLDLTAGGESRRPRRWSPLAFVYRKEGIVMGIYWPDLAFPSYKDPEPVRLVHTFGHFDAASGTISNFTCITESGEVWRLDDVGPYVSIEASMQPSPENPRVPPLTPNDILRYEITIMEQLFTPEHRRYVLGRAH